MVKILFIKIDKKFIRVSYDEIIYIEAVNNYVRIITIKNDYLLLKKLKDVENVLCPEHFCRIHRSYIISFQYITAFDNNCVYLENKIILPISRHYKTILEDRVSGKPQILKGNIDESQKN